MITDSIASSKSAPSSNQSTQQPIRTSVNSGRRLSTAGEATTHTIPMPQSAAFEIQTNTKVPMIIQQHANNNRCTKKCCCQAILVLSALSALIFAAAVLADCFYFKQFINKNN